jgi:hypothetical protein
MNIHEDVCLHLFGDSKVVKTCKNNKTTQII